MGNSVIKFGAGVATLGSRPGSGTALEAMKPKEVGLPKSPETDSRGSLATIQAELNRVKMRTLFALDFSASTTRVIGDFICSVEDIDRMIAGEFRDTDVFFGKFDGDYPQVAISRKGDTSFLDRRNRQTGHWESTISAFLKHVEDERMFECVHENNQSVLMIFVDARGFDGADLAEGVAYLKKQDVLIFVFYEKTEYDDKSWFSKNIIKPLGESGILIDYRQINTKEIMRLIKACLKYAKTTQAAKKTGTKGGGQISFKNFLQTQGIDTKGVSQGEPLLQIVHKK